VKVISDEQFEYLKTLLGALGSELADVTQQYATYTLVSNIVGFCLCNLLVWGVCIGIIIALNKFVCNSDEDKACRFGFKIAAIALSLLISVPVSLVCINYATKAYFAPKVLILDKVLGSFKK